MPRSQSVLKLAAVASSVILVAGFVSYRAGAFDSVAKDTSASGQATDPPSTHSDGSPDAAKQMPSVTPVTPGTLYTTKSSIFVVPPGAAAGKSSGTAPPPPAIMGGSKSLAPIVPPSPPTQSPAPANPPAPGR